MSQTTPTSSRKLTWLVTGCSSGFGLSLARIIQANGHNLIATSRNPSATPDLVKDVEAHGGKWIELDVTSTNTADTISQLEKSGEHIDVLVNNAGFCKFAPIETATEEDVRKQFETMYLGPLRLIKAVIPFMRSRQFGLIINLSSGAAVDGNPTMGPYAGAKAALDATTKVLSKEVAAFNITTMTVIQGTSNTNFGKAPVWYDQPLPEVYKGSMSEKLLDAVKSSAVPANSDPDKAMRAVFEVAIEEHAAQHRIVPMGPDMVKRLEGLRQSADESLDKFGAIAMSAAVAD